MNDAPSLFDALDEPVARATDPETSHAAPATVDRDAIQRMILSIADTLGPFTHDDMCKAVNRRRELAGETQLEASTVRSRTNELVKQSLIRDTGKTATVRKPGKKRASKVTLWQITSLGHFRAPSDERQAA
ncbi:MAG: hypothetical protein KGZ65_06200 [Sphingomonadales bacterium]|nr:hypothetical protein [Sphingomonadaceae bacterium]MBS3930811.1 hypothetical protein [Sphingomonadales bacterium]